MKHQKKPLEHLSKCLINGCDGRGNTDLTRHSHRSANNCPNNPKNKDLVTAEKNINSMKNRKNELDTSFDSYDKCSSKIFALSDSQNK